MSEVLTRAMNGNYKKYIKAYLDETLRYANVILTDKVDLWYVLFHDMGGDKDEFVGGSYIVELKAPKEFPFKPPTLRVLTPNGVFEAEHNVCLSIGSYHPNAFAPTTGILGYISLVYSAFIGWKDLRGGVGVINSATVESIKEAAAKSDDYNRKNFAKLLNDMEEQHAAIIANK